MRRFNKIGINFPSYNSTTVGTENEEDKELDCLFEMNTIAVIRDRDDDEIEESEVDMDEEMEANSSTKVDRCSANNLDHNAPLIAAAVGVDFIAVAVGEDLSLFSISTQITFTVTLHLGDDVSVFACCFLPVRYLFALLTTAGMLIIMNASSRRVVLSMSVLEEGERVYSMYSACDEYTCHICAACGDEGYIMIEWDKYYQFSDTQCLEKDSLGQNQPMEGFRLFRFKHHPCRTSLLLFEYSLQLFISSNSGSALIAVLKDLENKKYTANHSVSPLFLADRLQLVGMRLCDRYRSVLTLSCDGWLTLYDLGTMMKSMQENIITSEQIVKDFLCLDGSEKDFLNSRLVLLIQDAENIKLQVRQVNSNSIIYSVNVAAECQLWSNIGTDDHAIIYTESSDLGYRGASIRLCAIVENDPQSKLNRLLSSLLFDKAELFAEKFNLNIEEVHKSRVSHMLMDLEPCDVQDECVVKFLKYMDKIHDSNWVGETCVSGVTICQNFKIISKLLSYADNRLISDVDIREKLVRIRYNLATYRMVYGPGQISYDHKSAWFEYFNDTYWVEIFLHFCGQGNIDEAHIIWARYRGILESWLINEYGQFKKVLDTFTRGISTKIGAIWDALHVLEQEILPTVLTVDPLKISSLYISWVQTHCNLLELHQPVNYPSNVLYLVSSLKRVSEQMIENASTPGQQAYVAYDLAQMKIDSKDPNDAMGALNIMMKNLDEMEKLKRVYRCSLTYNQYLASDSKSICYAILARACNLEATEKEIKFFAKPFIEQYGLDYDQTIYNYVMEVASIPAKVLCTSYSYVEISMALVEHINSGRLRCEAIICIMKHSRHPWPQQLSDTVHAMMSDRSIGNELSEKLRIQSHMADLDQLISRYRIPILNCDIVRLSTRTFLSIAQRVFRLSSTEASVRKRLSDILQMCVLANKIKSNVIDQLDCLVQLCIFLMRSGLIESSFTEVSNVIDELNDFEKKRFVEKLLIYIRQAISTRNLFLNKSQLDTRMCYILATLRIVGRIFKDTMKNEAESLRAVRKMQEEFNTLIDVELLYNQKRKMQMLSDYIDSELILKQSLQWPKLLRYSRCLLVDEIDFVGLLVERAIKFGNSTIVLQVTILFLNCDSKLSEQQIERALNACEYTLWKMYEINVEANAEMVFTQIELLSEVVPILAEKSYQFFSHQQRAIVVESFVELARKIIEQCSFDSGSHAVQSIEMSGLDHKTLRTRRIYGMNRRVGVYMLKVDGPIYNRIDAIRRIVALGRCAVVNPPIEESKLNDYYSSSRSEWQSLFNFLNVSKQYQLELSARYFAIPLPCFHGHSKTIFEGMDKAVIPSLQHILSHNPCDLWLSVSVLFCLPRQRIKCLLVDLREWCKSRRMTHIMLSFLRICQFSSFVFQDFSFSAEINKQYSLSMWKKNLSKLGMNIAVNAPLPSIVKEFVRTKSPVQTLIEFCDCFSIDSSEATIQYALTMAIQSSVEAERNSAAEMLGLSAYAFTKIGPVEDIYLRIFECLMLTSPYSYEVLELLVVEMKKCSVHDDENRRSDLRKFSTILLFLFTTGRTRGATNDEIRWYHERERFLTKKVREHISFFGALKAITSISNEPLCSQESNESGCEELWHTATNLPTNAHNRLPFHIFLFEQIEDVENVLLPIINNELTLFNVNAWQNFFRDFPELMISKSSILSRAIVISLREKIKNNTVLENGVLDIIRDLMFRSSNRVGLIKALKISLSDIPLCETKFRLISVFIDVAQKWLTVIPSSESLKSVSEEETATISQYLSAIVPSLRKYRAKYLLQQSKLCYPDCIDLLSKPHELIRHIYSNHVDWRNDVDRDAKMSVVKKLSENFGIDLPSILNKLVSQWLLDGSTEYIFDPNDTIGDLPEIVKIANKGAMCKLPFLEECVSRIVFICEADETKQTVFTLLHFLKQSSVVVDCAVKIRAICCILRLDSNQSFKNILSEKADVLCSNLETTLYADLMESSKANLSAETFKETDKTIALKSLLSSNIRPSLKFGSLMASLIIDYQIHDAVVDDVLKELINMQAFEMLRHLILFCTTNKVLSDLKTVPAAWKILAKFYGNQTSTDDNHSPFRVIKNQTLFCISCPIELGPCADALRKCKMLNSSQIASALIEIACQATKQFESNKIFNATDHDLQLQWAMDTAKEHIRR